MTERKDIQGQRFGKLVAVRPSERKHPRGKYTYWFVVCDCGTEKEAATSRLLAGKPRSCGCECRRNVRLEYFHEVVMKYEGNECLTWPFAPGPKGYGTLSLNNKQFLVSRLVCAAVHGEVPTKTHQAVHSCGKDHLGCVAKSHLSWKTPKENCDDKILHGTGKVGYEKAKEIRALYGQFTQDALAKKYQVGQSVISEIVRGIRWVQP